MKVNEFSRRPVGMAWGLRLQRYDDGSAAFIVWDNETTPREVVLSISEVLELIAVLEGTANQVEV